MFLCITAWHEYNMENDGQERGMRVGTVRGTGRGRGLHFAMWSEAVPKGILVALRDSPS